MRSILSRLFAACGVSDLAPMISLMCLRPSLFTGSVAVLFAEPLDDVFAHDLR